VCCGLVQDPVPRGHRAERHRADDADQRAEQDAGDPLGHPRHGRRHRGRHRDRRERRRPGRGKGRERAEGGGEYGADDGRRRQADRRAGHDHAGEAYGEHAVGRDDVAGPEQHDVHGADRDQPPAAPAHQADHGPLLDPCGGPAGRKLSEPVAEQEAEERVRPAVDEGELQSGDHRVRAGQLGRVGADPERPVEQVQVHVGQRDEQEHRPAGRVRGERAVAHRYGADGRGPGRGHGRDPSRAEQSPGRMIGVSVVRGLPGRPPRAARGDQPPTA
jgi:hypothetical protein